LISKLPEYYASFQSLRVLSVGYNKIQGSIFYCITNLSKLWVLDLSNNKFIGRIPFNLGRLLGFQIPRSSPFSDNTLYIDVKLSLKALSILRLTYVLETNIMWTCPIIISLEKYPKSWEIWVTCGCWIYLKSLGRENACLSQWDIYFGVVRLG